MLKLTCPTCGYTVRTTRKWLAVGQPFILTVIRSKPPSPNSVMSEEQMFYPEQMEEFPEVPCKRCERLNGLLYTVPLYLPATETNWQSLCGDCFGAVLNVEPQPGQAMHPVKHGRRSRRKWG